MPDGIGTITKEQFSEALSSRYLEYAVSTIVSRALPDARDGMKPVHRRIIYAMLGLNLIHSGPYRKSARIVGDTLGKYHPHGDGSVYDAMVRLAQDFASRYPLVDGQGNFGNIDGDTAAAMRYTESRMSPIAGMMLDGIGENAVDFKQNYDGSETEPVVLPASFPNLLANGCSGIAVGMATNIPPHNAVELYSAALHLISNPGATVKDLMAFVPAPDFPTGGEIVSAEHDILAVYEMGTGPVRVRAKWHTETRRDGTKFAVVTEIPYGVVKATLISEIDDLLFPQAKPGGERPQRKLTLVGDVRDESSEDIRVVLEPKSRSVDLDAMMAQLYRHTKLAVNFSCNMNVLNRRQRPGVMSLKGLLREWLDHQFEVASRRAQHRATEIERRLNILSGYIAIFGNIDLAVKIIREEEAPKAALMVAFGLNEVQADAVLNMRLRSLGRLDENKVRDECAKLGAELAGIRLMLSTEGHTWAAVGKEIEANRTRLAALPGSARRTLIVEPAAGEGLEQDADTVREPVEPATIVFSTKGWVKAFTGHGVADTALKLKDGDAVDTKVECQSSDSISILAKNGRVYSIKVNALPRGRGDGQALRLLIDLPNDVGILRVMVPDVQQKYLVASSAGYGFTVLGVELSAAKMAGKPIMVLQDGQTWNACIPLRGDHVAIISSARKMLLFPLASLPEYPKGKGVVLQKYGQETMLAINMIILANGLTYRDKRDGGVRSVKDLGKWVQGRGTKGCAAPLGVV